MLLLKRFPLCGTSNNMYTSVRGRLIKSNEARKFDASVEIYKLREFKILNEWKSTVKETDVFNIDCYFVFTKDRVYTKKNTIKKKDTTNYIKQTNDGLSKMLGIDDCRFITGSYHKVYCRFPQDEQVIIVVKKTSLLSLDESLELISKCV